MFDASFYTRRQREKCRKMAAHKILWTAIPLKKTLRSKLCLLRKVSLFLTLWIPLLFPAQLTIPQNHHEIQMQTGFPWGHPPTQQFAVFLFAGLTKASVSAIIRSVRMYLPVFIQLSQEAGNGKEKAAEQAQLSKAAAGRSGAGSLSLFRSRIPFHPVLVYPGIRTVIGKTAFNTIHIGAVR